MHVSEGWAVVSQVSCIWKQHADSQGSPDVNVEDKSSTCASLTQHRSHTKPNVVPWKGQGLCFSVSIKAFHAWLHSLYQSNTQTHKFHFLFFLLIIIAVLHIHRWTLAWLWASTKVFGTRASWHLWTGICRFDYTHVHCCAELLRLTQIS